MDAFKIPHPPTLPLEVGDLFIHYMGSETIKIRRFSLKTEFFGKNGQITQQFKTLGALEPDKRRPVPEFFREREL